MVLTDTELAADLAATVGPTFVVERKIMRGWIDVRVESTYAMGDPLDFVRIIRDDQTYRILHMTHSEVVCGEARMTGSLTGFICSTVKELCESLF